MTPRMVNIYALIAGINYKDSRKLAPGFILDAFIQRHKYDQAHSLRL